MGHNPDSFVGKPIIGIFNAWNDCNSCNYTHQELVEFVKRGVPLAGKKVVTDAGILVKGLAVPLLCHGPNQSTAPGV